MEFEPLGNTDAHINLNRLLAVVLYLHVAILDLAINLLIPFWWALRRDHHLIFFGGSIDSVNDAEELVLIEILLEYWLWFVFLFAFFWLGPKLALSEVGSLEGEVTTHGHGCNGGKG